MRKNEPETDFEHEASVMAGLVIAIDMILASGSPTGNCAIASILDVASPRALQAAGLTLDA